MGSRVNPQPDSSDITPLRRALFEQQRTQAEIAKKIGLDRPIFSHVVSGRIEPNATDKAAIAAELNTTVAALWPVPSEQRAAA